MEIQAEKEKKVRRIKWGITSRKLVGAAHESVEIETIENCQGGGKSYRGAKEVNREGNRSKASLI